jgi:hypothetical protein
MEQNIGHYYTSMGRYIYTVLLPAAYKSCVAEHVLSGN